MGKKWLKLKQSREPHICGIWGLRVNVLKYSTLFSFTLNKIIRMIISVSECFLSLSWRRFLSYKTSSLKFKSMDWLLNDRDRPVWNWNLCRTSFLRKVTIDKAVAFNHIKPISTFIQLYQLVFVYSIPVLKCSTFVGFR